LRPHLFKFFATVSVLLFILTIAAWIFSYCYNQSRGDAFHWGNEASAGYGVSFYQGYARFDCGRNIRPALLDSHGEAKLLRTSQWYGLGMCWRNNIVVKKGTTINSRSPGSFGTTSNYWLALYWPLLISLPFTGLGARSIVKYMRKRNLPPAGLCKTCGYDLRATPGRCPECGTPVTRPTA
jgi:hypothetical protein